jgi:hypothetical protein
MKFTWNGSYLGYYGLTSFTDNTHSFPPHSEIVIPYLKQERKIRSLYRWWCFVHNCTSSNFFMEYITKCYEHTRTLRHYTSSATTILYVRLHVSTFYTVIIRPFLWIKLSNAAYMLGSHYVYNVKMHNICMVNYINKSEILFKTARR